jgi:ubiquinone/menaquinone biosynthesis C-methylase UbiE
VDADRVLREKTASDSSDVYAESSKLHRRFIHVFESPNTRRGEAFFESKLKMCCNGAEVLDYGCLDGVLAPMYKSYGAKKITGIDISSKGIASAKRNYGDIATFYECDAHQLSDISDNSLDLVVGRAILHHLNYEVALREVHRVLRPGGTALFVEPLYDNPLSILFRKLTPRARTKDERPLSRQQIEWTNSMFSSQDHYFVNLLTTPLAMLTSSLPLSPNNALLQFADGIDNGLQRSPIRYWMRNAYLCWIK